MPSGIPWLDRIVDEANFPKFVDREGAAMIVARLLLLTEIPSKDTVQRWPIPYQVIGRSARYRVDDVVAFARKRLAETPVRKAPERKRPRHTRAEATVSTP